MQFAIYFPLINYKNFGSHKPRFQYFPVLISPHLTKAYSLNSISSLSLKSPINQKLKPVVEGKINHISLSFSLRDLPKPPYSILIHRLTQKIKLVGKCTFNYISLTLESTIHMDMQRKLPHRLVPKGNGYRFGSIPIRLVHRDPRCRRSSIYFLTRQALDLGDHSHFSPLFETLESS